MGGAGEGLLRFLGRELDRRFGTRSFIGPRLPLREGWLDPASGQYASGAILDALLARMEGLGWGPESIWSLGVAEADLGAPGRTFVFGEATVGGPCAVIGVARLGGGWPFSQRLRTRALTEAVHELGHLAGLGHCDAPACVMLPSEGAEGVDRKGGEFCPGCARALSGLLLERSA